MKDWIWGYAYRLNYYGEISESWPASLFYMEAEACRREGIERGDQNIPISLEDFSV